MDRAIQLAHAAGIIDGEGCFGIARRGNSYIPTVQVVMTDEKPLSRILGLFGGSIQQTKKDPKGNKIPFHYSAKGKNAKQLICGVFPFLTEKKEQADVLLELRENIDEWNAKPRQRGNLPDDVLAYRHNLYEKSKELKCTGVFFAKKNCIKNKRERLAYLTGILEAEGCFSIVRGNKNHFFSSITVQMRCKAVLEMLNEEFSGTIIERNTKHGKIFMWRAKGQLAADVCRSIFPYICFRYEEADLLRQLQNTTNLWAKRVGCKGMPEHVTAKREAWMQRIQMIHKGAGAQTKSEQPQRVSDSRICNELSVAGPLVATAA